MPRNEDLINEFINGVGAVAETCKIFSVELMKNGFDGHESLYLVGKFIEGLFTGMGKQDN